ncbi:hypothetical protein GE061_010957 [Apolygus lucorum]|uniref:Lipid-binding serum glycoprotein N-terminal domain-containing protein n=1 Tax=Apolygus lucorum TaxID=248454 RepID=A0A6A4K3W2_APOLU|nr:hypothetical protein GE061_010957 [Apolygus lucorum]
MLKLATIFFCLGAAVASDVDTYNSLVDETLFLAQQLMVQYKFDTLPLPPISVSYNNANLAPSWTSVTGTLATGPGTVVNATGIHRSGDAKITLVDDDKMVVDVGITLDPMVVTFLKFDISFSSPFPLSSSGGMQIKLGQNDATLQITFQKNTGVCKLNIDTATLTGLGSVDLLILPDTWWAEIKDKGVDYYLGNHNDDLKIVTNKYLQSALQSAIDKVNPCQYLPF